MTYLFQPYLKVLFNSIINMNSKEVIKKKHHCTANVLFLNTFSYNVIVRSIHTIKILMSNLVFLYFRTIVNKYQVYC